MAVAHVGPWTEDDLLSLPPDDQRYELLEGALMVNPPPSYAHQRTSLLLARFLDAAAPDDLVVVEAVGVRVPDGLFVPDIVVADRAGAEASVAGVLPADIVRLVVEVVSPGSRSMDRLTKPSLYAEAAIEYYWRVELENGPSIHVHRLQRPGEYLEVGFAQPGERLVLDEPFPISLGPEELRR